ncbi:MAG: hypothetical protein QM504_01035 [Pseudomonadota bacterium]
MTTQRIGEAKVALKVFFCAVDEWCLTEREAQLLLNNNSQSDYDDYKQCVVGAVSDDLLHRLAHITKIYENLRLLYSDENIILWLKNSSEKKSKWQGNSPLERMTESINGIIYVFDYLNGLSGR